MKLLSSFLKKYNSLFFIFTIMFLYSIPLFHTGLFVAHDNIPQIARIAERFEAFSDGQIPARWAGGLNYGYGNPGFIFFYSLSDYTAILVYLLGFTLQDSYKILMALIFIIAPLFFYLWSSLIFKRNAAIISSLFYGLAHYKFLDTFVRGHLGESLALVFPPLILFFIERNLKKISIFNIVLGGISYALLIHSHSILGLVFSFLIFGYIIVRSFKEKRILASNILLLLIGLGLSAYFWIPALLEAKYINSKIFLSDWYKDHFLNIGNIIYSRWGFGSNVNEPGGLSAQIGPLHVLFSISCIPIIFGKIKNKRVILYWLFVLAMGVFFSTSLSDLLWSKIHLLQQFQFPWRITAVSFFAASVLTGHFFNNFFNKKIFILSILLLLLFSLPMTKISGYVNYSDKYYFDFPGTAAYHNEATTIWVEGDAYKFPDASVEVISGSGKIENLKRKSNLHLYSVNAESNVRILDNTVYFPGWRAKVDGKKVPIEFQDINQRGLITFDVPKGIHNVSVKFGESPIRLAADIISLMFVFSLFAVFIFRKKLNLIVKKP